MGGRATPGGSLRAEAKAKSRGERPRVAGTATAQSRTAPRRASRIWSTPPASQPGHGRPGLVVGDEVVDSPPVIVVASPAAGADHRHLAVLLEERERHLPRLTVHLIHAGRGIG
jgi:hypothetical protein